MGRTGLKRLKNQSLVPLPTDLVVEVLKRLPTKSLAKFLLVSKPWKTIIRSRDFIRSYSLRYSSSCLLFTYLETDRLAERQDWFFFSSTGINQDVPDFISRMSSYHVSEIHESHQYVHGLMMLVYEQYQVIVNPSIRKSITLPRLITSRIFKEMFLGYDPVDGIYKVLCVFKEMYGSRTPVAPSEHKILTLGSSEWRNIELSSPHVPISKCLCIDGVLCYLAYMGDNVRGCVSLARFEVRSEKMSFVITTISNGLYQPCLVRYMEKIAIANQTSWNKFDLWVLEDAKKHEWSKICLSIHNWNNMVSIYPLRIVGTAHTGEIMVMHYDSHRKLYLIYHDPKSKSQIMQKEIQGVANYNSREFRRPLCVVDHTVSVMLL